jgi:hypothetical protein
MFALFLVKLAREVQYRTGKNVHFTENDKSTIFRLWTSGYTMAGIINYLGLLDK